MRMRETGILREHAITILARLVVICFLLADLSASAETSPVRISAETDAIDLFNATWLLEDPDGQLKLTDVQSPANASRFKIGSPARFKPKGVPAAARYDPGAGPRNRCGRA